MKYNIITIADIHWGVIQPKEQLKSLEFVFETIQEMIKNDLRIDLIVVLGDYFDTRLVMDNEDGIYALQWFHKLYSICKENQIQLRLVQGTSSHDNDQLQTFMELQENNDWFKIFFTTTVEETLKDLTCCYCPDETIETNDYESIHMDDIFLMKDLGFFHGSFDLVYGDLLSIKPELMKANNVMYRYSLWDPQIRGPLIAGHWHDGKQYSDLYYCGSPFRWVFDENEPKGLIFIQYDTEAYSYYIQRILNPLCATYLTYEIYTNLYQTKEDYISIIKDIDQLLIQLKEDGLDNRLRIVVYIVDDKVENDTFLSSLRQNVINHKNCKITVKNKLKDKKKKEKAKKRKEEDAEYRFIFEKNQPQDTIHDYILKTSDNQNSVPIEYLTQQVKKYI